MERYEILWLGIGIVLPVLAPCKGLLTTLSQAKDIDYPPAALLAVGVVTLVLFSRTVSRLPRQNKVLAQRLGIAAA